MKEDMQELAKLLDAMAEEARQEAAKTKNASHQKAIWGVVAGLEIAATVTRSTDIDIQQADAVSLLKRYRETHYAYLVKTERREFKKRPPNLKVSKVVKGKAKD